ncbi:hypothetical protein ACUY3H_02825 [Corynebacterium ureicelerivorans]
MVKKIYELDDQPIDPERVSHVVSWIVPLPTFLPIDELSTFTAEPHPRNGTRLVIRFFSSVVHSVGGEEIWDLTDVASRHFGFPGDEDADLQERYKPPIRRTFAEIAGFIELRELHEDEVEMHVATVFDWGLDFIREIQNSVFGIDHVARPLISLQTLPQLVPQSIYSVSGDAPESSQMNIYLIPSVMQAQTHWYPPTDREDSLFSQSEVVLALERQLENGPFNRYSELFNDAQVAYYQLGLHRSAVLSAASAGEVLLDEALRCILWESSKTPEEAGKLFANKREFKPRATSLLQRYLGGEWRLKGEGVISRWFRDVYSLRHRIIHAGESPTAIETRLAIGYTSELSEFLADRLADNIARFPRTAMFLLGIPGLEKRDLWTSRLADLSLAPNEPHWVSTFVRWRESTEIIRECEKFRRRLEGDAELASVVFWVHPTGASKWVLMDSRALAAAEVAPLELDGLHENDLEETESAVAKARAGELDQPLMRTFMDASLKRGVTVDWVLPYRVLPMMNVMVDRSDQNFD